MCREINVEWMNKEQITICDCMDEMNLIKYTSIYMQYVAIYTAIYDNNHRSQLYLFCNIQREFLLLICAVW